jgi:hypothetical protein
MNILEDFASRKLGVEAERLDTQTTNQLDTL